MYGTEACRAELQTPRSDSDLNSCACHVMLFGFVYLLTFCDTVAPAPPCDRCVIQCLLARRGAATASGLFALSVTKTTPKSVLIVVFYLTFSIYTTDN